MKQLTIRNVSPELDRRLLVLSKSKRQSVNTLVLEILKDATGIDERRERLRRYMTWSTADREQFDDVLREQRQVDAKAWR